MTNDEAVTIQQGITDLGALKPNAKAEYWTAMTIHLLRVLQGCSVDHIRTIFQRVIETRAKIGLPSVPDFVEVRRDLAREWAQEKRAVGMKGQAGCPSCEGAGYLRANLIEDATGAPYRAVEDCDCYRGPLPCWCGKYDGEGRGCPQHALDQCQIWARAYVSRFRATTETAFQAAGAEIGRKIGETNPVEAVHSARREQDASAIRVHVEPFLAKLAAMSPAKIECSTPPPDADWRAAADRDDDVGF